MLAVRFRPIRRNRPDLLVQVDLVPRRARDLAWPRCGEDQELQRARRNTLAPPQLGKERRQLVERQRRVMLDLMHLAAPRKDMSQVAFPLRRVWSLPETLHNRAIEHRLDPAAQPT